MGLCVLAGFAVEAGAQEPLRATVSRVCGDGEIELEDGQRVRLQGLSLPAEAVRPKGARADLRAFLEDRLLGRAVWVFSRTKTASDGDGLVGRVSLAEDGACVNEQALYRGLAVFADLGRDERGLDRLRAASRQARRDRRGLFSRTSPRAFEEPPFLNGAVIGLHYKTERARYTRQIDELAQAGFRHVSFLFPVFVQNVEAHKIQRSDPRTVSDRRLIETIRHAKSKGLSVMLLPIVLLHEFDEVEWRGTLRPKKRDLFWSEYELFLAHYLDIAEATGVEIFSVGSEFSSLESDTAAWTRVIGNARGRFSGLLTYSVNWDHAHEPRFFGLLDIVGVTGYFSLTAERNPSRAQIEAAWRARGKELEALVGSLGKPVIFTEVGYASQDGINRDPWNYHMNPDRIDLDEQADCFAAFLAVSSEFTFLEGAYLYDYFGEGGEQDPSYSPRGKPAWKYWRLWAGR